MLGLQIYSNTNVNMKFENITALRDLKLLGTNYVQTSYNHIPSTRDATYRKVALYSRAAKW